MRIPTKDEAIAATEEWGALILKREKAMRELQETDQELAAILDVLFSHFDSDQRAAVRKTATW